MPAMALRRPRRRLRRPALPPGREKGRRARAHRRGNHLHRRHQLPAARPQPQRLRQPLPPGHPHETARAQGRRRRHVRGNRRVRRRPDLPHARSLRAPGLRLRPRNVYVELQRHLDRDEEARNQALVERARRLGLGIVATNGPWYAAPRQREVLDVLTCVRHHTTLAEAGRLLAANSERHVKSPAEMARLFADLPEAIANTTEISRPPGVHPRRPRLRVPALPRSAGRDHDVLPAQAHRRGRAQPLPALSRDARAARSSASWR